MSTQRIEFVRRVYDNVYSWYQNADTKAQVVLAMDAAFLAFLTGGVFAKADEVNKAAQHFYLHTRILLGLMVFCLFCSILSAILCLRSRIYTRREQRKIIEEACKEEAWKESSDKTKYPPYPPQVMLFFQFISGLEQPRFRDTLRAVDEEYEIDTLASQIEFLSRNVHKKHWFVNYAFILAVWTLLLFLAAGIVYLSDNI